LPDILKVSFIYWTWYFFWHNSEFFRIQRCKCWVLLCCVIICKWIKVCQNESLCTKCGSTYTVW